MAAPDGEWVTAVARPNTPLFLSFLISGQNGDEIERHTGLPIGFSEIRRDGIKLQYTSAQIAAARDVIHSHASERGLAFFEEYGARCLSSSESVLRTVRELGEAPDGRDLADLLGAYFASVVAHATFLQTMILVQFELEHVLEEIVGERMGGGKESRWIIDALKLALEPNHEIVNVTELLELGKLVQETVPDHRSWITADPADLIVRIAQRHPELWDGVRAFAQRFGWMGRSYYVGAPTGPADVVIRLQTLLADDCSQRLDAATANRERQLSERRTAIEALGRDGEVERLAAVVSGYMHLRTFRLDVFFMAHEHMVDVFTDLARELGLRGYEDTAYLAWWEIESALGGAPNAAELGERIAARRGGFEFRVSEGVTEWKPAASPASAGARPAAGSPDAEQLLRGITGCPGTFTGRVRVVSNNADVAAMQPGEVLVTTMTLPSRMAAVERAGAIVTDEGGMLCHAVIVSREFDIPCVIGTGSATEQLRTGDTVQVDAGAGVVRLVAGPASE